MLNAYTVAVHLGRNTLTSVFVLQRNLQMLNLPLYDILIFFIFESVLIQFDKSQLTKLQIRFVLLFISMLRPVFTDCAVKFKNNAEKIKLRTACSAKIANFLPIKYNVAAALYHYFQE